MATGLRPDLIVRQVFRTAQPVVPASQLPAVLVGINRQLEYRLDAGSYTGGQENGDYSFPGLMTSSAVEPTTSADPMLRPKVYLSTNYGVAEITDDVTFSNLNNVGAAPSFEIAVSPEATFQVATGSTGSYAASTGVFSDPNADFIENLVGVGDVVKLNGTPAFTVTSVSSDDQLGVTKLSHGPSDAAVSISAASATGIRTVTYTGDLGNAYDGFVTSKVRVGDTVDFNGWKNLFTSGGLYFGATGTNGRRTLTAPAGNFNGTNIGDIISLYVIRDGVGAWIPYFVSAETVTTSATTLSVFNIKSDIADIEVRTVDESVGYKVDSASATTITDGAFTAQDTLGARDFSSATSLTTNSYVITYAARTDGVSLTSAADSLTRSTGSFISEGYVAGQTILITAGGQAGKVRTIADVSALVLTLTTGESPALTVTTSSTSIIAVPVAGLFKIDNGTTGASSDLYDGVIPAAAFGTNIKTSLVTLATNNTPVVASLPSVSAVISSVNRTMVWPGDLSASPAAGDYIFSEDGDLLFEFVSRVNVSATATLTGASGAAGTITFTGSLPTGLNTTAGAKFQLGVGSAAYTANAYYTVVSVAGLAVSVTADDGIFTDAGAATVNVQQAIVKNHANAPFVVPSNTAVTGSMMIRDQQVATYKVVRVNSQTEIQVKPASTALEIPSGTAIIRGATTSIVVPDLLSDEIYTVEKTLSGVDLQGTVLVTYAARRKDHLNELIEVTQGTVTDVVGPAVPHNPLGLAALNAVNNTGVPVYCVQVTEDTDAGWADAMNLIKTNQIYAVAPLTQDEERLAEFQAHVTTQSQPENKRERILFQSHRNETQTTRWTMSSLESATFVKTASTQTITVTTASGLVGLGVKAGDVVEGTFYGYLIGSGFVGGSLASLSSTGTTLAYARVASVSEVGGETTLTLVPIDDSVLGDTLAVGVDMVTLTVKSKVLNTVQYRDSIAAYPATLQNRRVRNVYPDRALISFDDTTNPNDTSVGFYGGGEVTDYEVGGWLMAATIAAQRSGLPASTPLTRRGFSGVQRLVNPFGDNVADLDVILDGGNYLLAQEGGDGASCYAIRAITTNTTDLNYLEEAVGVQIDNFARKLRRQVTPILGTTLLDEGFFDLFSTISAAVVSDVLRNKEIREIKLTSLSEDPLRADTFLANYEARPYFSAAKGDVTIYI